MYSSKIKEIWEKINSNYQILNSEKDLLKFENLKDNKNIFNEEDYHLISDFLINKFPETSKIFSKFSKEDLFSFIYLSKYCSYEKGNLIFSKDEKCNIYAFILNGDINLCNEKDISSKTEINTLSSGNIYGHLTRDKNKFFISAKNNVSLITILKSYFDELIISINNRKKSFKLIFIKKFFPKIRIFTNDVINNILTYFERVQFKKYDRILIKDSYNEYIYLIISGEVGYCLKPKKIFNNDELNNYDYILLEKLQRGELIGINSAINGIKNIYNCIVLSEEADFYRISKGDFLYYFGGKYSDSSLNLKSIGDLQDMAVQNKIKYLKNLISNEKNFLINNFCIKIPEEEKIIFENACLIIYEDPIENSLFEKWKTIKLGLSDFKNKLLGQKKKRMDEIKKINFNNNDNNRKEYGLIKKNQNYSIYRVTNGRLNLKLNSNQMKSLNKLNGLCGIKNDNKNSKEDDNNSKSIKFDEDKKINNYHKSQ